MQVVSTNGGRLHLLDDAAISGASPCWCRPTVMATDAGSTLVHHRVALRLDDRMRMTVYSDRLAQRARRR